MVRIMNYAYYMLYELITYIQIFFGNLGYYTAYPFYALFNKGHVLRENREIMNQKYMNHTSYSVSYYASGIFYLGYVIFLADIIVFLYVFGVDLTPYIFDMAKGSIITLILAFVIPYPIQKKIIDDREKTYFEEFSKFTSEQHLKYSIYGILYYLFPLILLVLSSYLAYHRWLSLGGC